MALADLSSSGDSSDVTEKRTDALHTRDIHVVENLLATGYSSAESDKDVPKIPEQEPPDVSSEQEEEGSTSPEPEVQPMSGLRWFSVCVGLYLTAFLYGLDSTIAADVQGPILESLGNLTMLPWVGTGFLLGSVAVISLFGSLYNKAEVKWLYLGSILTFEVGSAICGAAPNMEAMTIGRVIAGIGGSGMYLGCMTYISIFPPPAQRPLYTALISAYVFVSHRQHLRD